MHNVPEVPNAPLERERYEANLGDAQINKLAHMGACLVKLEI